MYFTEFMPPQTHEPGPNYERVYKSPQFIVKCLITIASQRMFPDTVACCYASECIILIHLAVWNLDRSML